jgi:hypothetical protein
MDKTMLIMSYVACELCSIRVVCCFLKGYYDILVLDFAETEIGRETQRIYA